METTNTVPVDLADYTEQLEDMTSLLQHNLTYLESTAEVTQAIYICMLFIVGVGGAILVLLTLYNFLKKCY